MFLNWNTCNLFFSWNTSNCIYYFFSFERKAGKYNWVLQISFKKYRRKGGSFFLLSLWYHSWNTSVATSPLSALLVGNLNMRFIEVSSDVKWGYFFASSFLLIPNTVGQFHFVCIMISWTLNRDSTDKKTMNVNNFVNLNLLVTVLHHNHILSD